MHPTLQKASTWLLMLLSAGCGVSPAHAPTQEQAPTPHQAPPKDVANQEDASAAKPSAVAPAPPESDVTHAIGTGNGPSCELEQKKYVENLAESKLKQHSPAPPEISQYLNDGSYLRDCNVPNHLGLRVCSFIQDGRATGVTVTLSANEPAYAYCVANVVRAFKFPVSDEPLLAVTSFKAGKEPEPLVRGASPPSKSDKFDLSAADDELSIARKKAKQCGMPTGTRGEGKVRVTFTSTGRVMAVELAENTVQDALVNQCITDTFRAVSVPPFVGDDMTIAKGFVTGPPPECPSDKLTGTPLRDAWAEFFPVEEGGVVLYSSANEYLAPQVSALGVRVLGHHLCDDRQVWWMPGVECGNAAALTSAIRSDAGVNVAACFAP